MLISAQHPTIEGRIPPDLFDMYLRYKQDTRAIISWLTSHGKRKHKRRRTVSIRDLLAIADILRTKVVIMPDAIDFHFREAISARTQLSIFFRREGNSGEKDPDTINHEFFTASLKKIYKDLCQCVAKPRESCEQSGCKVGHSARTDATTNRFTVLRPTESKSWCNHDPLSTNKLPECQCDADKRENLTATTGEKVPRLIDDPLGDAFELRKEIQEMSDLLSAVTSVWEQSAQGLTPLVVAAFITNAAFAEFDGVEQRLKILCNGSDPAALRSKFMQMQEGTDDFSKEGGPGQQVEALEQNWQLLLQCKHGYHAGKMEATSMVQGQYQITLRKCSDSMPMDRECLAMLLPSVTQHIYARRQPSNIVRISTPAYADVGYFLTHEGSENGLRCAYGLQVLLEAYKSYLFASHNHTCALPGCRLKALKFAQEAALSIRAVLEDSSMPCRCSQTLASHLENLQLDLNAFFQEKAFDLYFQSSWVCGSHLLEMLDVLFYYGLRLFSYRNYVGAVMHVYNVLRTLTGFQSIPLLEALRDTFSDILFPGGRPIRNFKACCLRFMGGRLQFKSHTSDHKSGSHHMVIPPHTAKATAGFGLRKEINDERFECSKVSIFHHVKERDYHLDAALWNRVHTLADTYETPANESKRSETHSCSHHSHSVPNAFSTSPQRRLQCLHNAVLADFNGPFPTAKLNFFAIYSACVRIVSLISDKTHGEEHRGLNCLCFLDAIVSAADRYKDNEHRLQPFGCKELVGSCKDAMRDALGGIEVEEFLWREI